MGCLVAGVLCRVLLCSWLGMRRICRCLWVRGRGRWGIRPASCCLVFLLDLDPCCCPCRPVSGDYRIHGYPDEEGDAVAEPEADGYGCYEPDDGEPAVDCAHCAGVEDGGPCVADHGRGHGGMGATPTPSHAAAHPVLMSRVTRSCPLGSVMAPSTRSPYLSHLTEWRAT